MPEQEPSTNYVSDFELHLIHAGRELLAATKTVIEGLDAALEVLEQRVEAQAKPPAKLEAIPIRRSSATTADAP